jgi:hypothetical protein
MKKVIIIYCSILFTASFFSCENTNEVPNFVPENNSTIDDGTSFFDMLRKIDLDILQSDSYSVDDLFNKYQIVLTDYSNYKYAKAARGQLIMLLVDKLESLKGDQIIYLISEIEKFDMAYPKQNYLLLEEAQNRGVMTPEEIQAHGKKAYDKALAKAYIWKAILHEMPTAPSENSYTSDVQKSYSERAYYSGLLEKYASEQD